MLSNVDLRHLRTFLAIVDCGGVSAAAFRLEVSLSRVSRDLSALETRLGIELCHRGRSGFALTPQGDDICHAARKLLSDVHSFEQRAQGTRQSLGGTFSLGVIDNVVTNPDAGVVSVLADMHQLFPDMLISVSVHTASLIGVQVRERNIDFAITGQPEDLEQLVYKPAFVESHRLYMSRRSPYLEAARKMPPLGTKKNAEAVPYISRDYRADRFKAFEQRYPLRVAARGSTLESILASVLAGVGCALLPSHFVDRVDTDDLVEVRTDHTPLDVQFYLVYRRDNANRRAVRALLGSFHRR